MESLKWKHLELSHPSLVKRGNPGQPCSQRGQRIRLPFACSAGWSWRRRSSEGLGRLFDQTVWVSSWNQIIKLLLMLFPPPGKLLTINPHLPKLDLSPRYHLETLSFEIHNVKGCYSLCWITLISLVSLLFPIRQQIPWSQKVGLHYF